MALVPPLPPPIFTRVPCPPVQFQCTSVHFACAYSLSPPIASSPSVFLKPAVHRQQRRLSPLVRPSEVYESSNWLPADAMLSLVSCTSSRSMQVCPPTCAAGSTWYGCGWRGVGDSAPLDDLEVLDASTDVAYPRRRIKRRPWTLVDDLLKIQMVWIQPNHSFQIIITIGWKWRNSRG